MVCNNGICDDNGQSSDKKLEGKVDKRLSKAYLFAVLIFTFINVHGQPIPKDLDGDGISDSIEMTAHALHMGELYNEIYFNKYISDIPIPIINFNPEFEVGFETKETVNYRYFSKSEVSSSQSNEYKTTDKTKTFDKASITIKAEYKAGSLYKDIGWGINVTNENSSGVETEQSQEMIKAWKSGSSELQEKEKDVKFEIDDNAGYIRALLTIRNQSPSHIIKVSNLKISVFGYFPHSKEKNKNRDDVEFASSYARLYKQFEKSEFNEVTIYPKYNLSYPNSVNVVIYLPVPTKAMHNFMNSGKSLYFKLDEFDVKVEDINVNPSSISFKSSVGQILKNDFKLTIINGGDISDYYIAKRDSAGYINLKTALAYLYKANVKYDTDTFRGIEIVSSIDGVSNTLSFASIKSGVFKEQELSQGRWFEVFQRPKGSQYDGGLSTPIQDPNIEITLAYLKGSELLPPKVEDIPLGSDTIEMFSDKTVVTKCQINKGYKIRIAISPFIRYYSQGNTQATTIVYNCGSGEKKFTYSLNSIISSDWKDGLTDLDLNKLQLYFSFDGIDKLYSISELKGQGMLISKSPNTWEIICYPPNELDPHRNYNLTIFAKDLVSETCPTKYEVGFNCKDFETAKSIFEQCDKDVKTHHRPFEGITVINPLRLHYGQLLNSERPRSETKIPEVKLELIIGVYGTGIRQ